VSTASKSTEVVMTRRRGGALFVAAGAIVLAVSALADPIGIGGGGSFGWKQTTGVIVGAALMGIGTLLALRRNSA
jgi:hypothetical protein